MYTKSLADSVFSQIYILTFSGQTNFCFWMRVSEWVKNIYSFILQIWGPLLEAWNTMRKKSYFCCYEFCVLAEKAGTE